MLWRHFLRLLGCTPRCVACGSREGYEKGFLVQTRLPGESYFCETCSTDWGHGK